MPSTSLYAVPSAAKSLNTILLPRLPSGFKVKRRTLLLTGTPPLLKASLTYRNLQAIAQEKLHVHQRGAAQSRARQVEVCFLRLVLGYQQGDCGTVLSAQVAAPSRKSRSCLESTDTNMTTDVTYFSSGLSSMPLVRPVRNSCCALPGPLHSQTPPSPATVLSVQRCPLTYTQPLEDRAKSLGSTMGPSHQVVAVLRSADTCSRMQREWAEGELALVS